MTRPKSGGLRAPEPLTQDHDVSRFDCGKPPLNDWLRQRALRNEGRASRCFVACTGKQVQGFYCLAAGAVQHADVPSALKRNMPPSIPVVIIGRMAVDLEWQEKGIGAGLLKDALLRILVASESVGVRAVLVHAVDQTAVPFCTRYGFQPFPPGTLTLFLPLDRIAGRI